MVERNKKVAIAMSGGLDSSVAAALLRQEGFDVMGVTIYFNLLGEQIIKYAQKVANSLGIQHRVVDLSSILQKKVIDNFGQEYLVGKTPNPCVRCNQYIKFGALLRHIRAWGCDYLATGHYAKKLKTQKGFLLKKGKDMNKDQSYFLYRLKQKQLRHLLFPLADMTKKEAVALAGRLHLPVVESRQSQEICFLQGKDYRKFLKKWNTCDTKPGTVVDKTGNIVGRHKGVLFYTIGQREGLNIALGYRAYVTKIDAKSNRIVLGRLRDAYREEFVVIKPSFILRPIKKKVVCKVKIRYNHKEAEAEVDPQSKNFKVRFKRAQFAVTPGQSAVFYHGDTVIGGGIIR